MAQGSARFLLEFQVTGDQEVVGKIREVGRAGTEAASELQALQGMEDPFAPVAEGADRKSTRLNSSHLKLSRMPSSA